MLEVFQSLAIIWILVMINIDFVFFSIQCAPFRNVFRVCALSDIIGFIVFVDYSGPMAFLFFFTLFIWVASSTGFRFTFLTLLYRFAFFSSFLTPYAGVSLSWVWSSMSYHYLTSRAGYPNNSPRVCSKMNLVDAIFFCSFGDDLRSRIRLTTRIPHTVL